MRRKKTLNTAGFLVWLRKWATLTYVLLARLMKSLGLFKHLLGPSRDEDGNMASQQSVELFRRASTFYQQQLRSTSESTHRGEYVAIEPESGDYFLGKTLSEAIQAARAAHPDRLPLALRVGHKTTIEIGAIYGASLRASTAMAVPASRMNLPTCSDGSRCLLM
jgi:hypothetical protein